MIIFLLTSRILTHFLFFTGRVNHPEDLLRYVRTQKNGNVNIFICNFCNKHFHRKGHGRDHVENVHYPDAFVYTCDMCDYQLKSRVALRNHIAVAHPKLKFNQ